MLKSEAIHELYEACKDINFNEANNQSKNKRTIMSDKISNEQLNQILTEIKKRTTRQAFRIKVDKSRKPALTDSQFGGMAYWDTQRAYPVTSDGHKMYLLAQFNFSQLLGITLSENAKSYDLMDEDE